MNTEEWIDFMKRDLGRGLFPHPTPFTTFDGVERKTFRSEAGQIIGLDYDVTAEKGELVLKVVDPDGKVIWDEAFREDTAGIVTLATPLDGFHTIRIEGQATAGGFDISWSAWE